MLNRKIAEGINRQFRNEMVMTVMRNVPPHWRQNDIDIK